MKFKSMQVKKGEQGFTLVELITVVAIVSLLVVYITIRLSSSNEDAKVALASTFILGKVPTVISAYKARHMNSCTGLPAGEEEQDTLRQELIERGLVGTTPWDEDWVAQYDNTNRRLQILFPTAGMEDPQLSVTDIVNNIYDAPQIDGLAVATDTTMNTAEGAGEFTLDTTTGARELPEVGTVNRLASIQIWYDCI